MTCFQKKPVNFLFDLTAAQPIRSTKFHGGGIYAEIVFFKLLSEYDKNRLTFFCVYDSTKYINRDLLTEARKKDVEIIDIQQIHPRFILEKYKIDVFYSALIQRSLGWNLGEVIFVQTIHGLRTLECPYDRISLLYEKSIQKRLKTFLKFSFAGDYFYRKIRKSIVTSEKEKIYAKNMKIITVSNHSKASLLSFYPALKPEDIQVFASPSFDQLKKHIPVKDFNFIQRMTGFRIDRKKYFLLVSSDRWIKNAMRAVFAFDSLFCERKAIDFKVVLTGANVSTCDEKKRIAGGGYSRIRHKDNFVFLGYIEREELESLYKNAYAFIYPSLNEGFGYPPVSAMKYGVPVAASGTTSIPEVCGDAALYFDPYNVSEIKNRIIQLLDTNIYSLFAERGKAQYKKISALQEKGLNELAEFLFHIGS